MIRLKTLLFELADTEIKRCLDKIKNNDFQLLGAGDNGRVYEINGEDKVFKITKERDEYQVAKRIVNRYSDFTTFIPVYYINGTDMYIMANAEQLDTSIRQEIDSFMRDFAVYARQEGGEVSIFDFMQQTDSINQQLDNFLTALETDIKKLNIPEFELDLDFRSDNVMQWNGKLVMVDW